jgi:hypothetical protein
VVMAHVVVTVFCSRDNPCAPGETFSGPSGRNVRQKKAASFAAHLVAWHGHRGLVVNPIMNPWVV